MLKSNLSVLHQQLSDISVINLEKAEAEEVLAKKILKLVLNGANKLFIFPTY